MVASYVHLISVFILRRVAKFEEMGLNADDLLGGGDEVFDQTTLEQCNLTDDS